MRIVSVIIPLWNGEKWIRPCLAALVRQAETAPFALEAIVVDNGSQDSGPDIVKRDFPGVRLLRNQDNLGFAGGCNVGLAEAAGDVLVLLNQDTVVRPLWLTGLVDAVDNPGVGVAGSLALLADGATIQHAGGVVDWPLGVARHLGYGERHNNRLDAAADVPFVTGASLAMRKEVLERIGLLDEDFFPGYYEDVDFCWRARDAGYSIRYVPDSVLVHAESGSFSDPFYTAWARLRGRLRFCLKHLPIQRFLDDFLPAETDYSPTVLAGDPHGQIARAYLEAISMAVELWPQRGATDEQIGAALRGLARLCPPLSPMEDNLGPFPGPGLPLLTPSPLDRIPLLGRARGALHRLAIFYSERRQRELLAVIRADRARIRHLEAEIAQSHKSASA